MPQYPKGDERDRHIAPISDAPDDETDQNDENPSENDDSAMNVTENADGSADVTFENEETETESGFDDNLAEYIDPDLLQSMGSDLAELVEKDLEAREKRDKQYEEGIRRSGLGDDAPGGASFTGASKVVHPMLAECCVDFAARAIKELFPPSGPVRTTIWGTEDEKRLDTAVRKARYMNWQLTKQMREYRAELEQMLTQLPMGGSQYQKFWFDSQLKRNRTEFVPIDDMALPYACADFYTAHRKTHVLHLTRHEFEKRIASGMYIDVTLPDSDTLPDQTASAEASDKVEGRDATAYNEDGLRDVFEIYVYYEVEQDGATDGQSAPYIISVDRATQRTLGVYRNWDENDDAMQPLDWFVEWKFIPWRGAYAIGFPHLIGGLSGAATGALRALLDSAHINNTATLVKLRGGKVSGQSLEVEPTQIAEIEGPAGTDDIRKVLMAMPYNPPSPTLFSLLGFLTEAGKGVIATAEESIKDVGDRTPVGTTMAMIEQGAHTYSAIHARLHYSQAMALQIISRLNKTYMDDQVQIKELGDLVISRQEFDTTDDIQPVSDPNIFAESQRFAQMQGAAQVRQMFPQQKWNDNALARGMLERLRIPNIDELLPKPDGPKNLNPAAENIAAMHGAPIIALPMQNHLAHISAHLDFCFSPIFGNPVFGAKAIGQMVRHLTEHVGFIYADMMERYTQFRERAQQAPTKEIEAAIATVSQKILQQMETMLQPYMQKIEQLAQMAQQMQPPPPMDPQVKATYDIGMAEVQRKSEYDKQMIALEQQKVAQIEPQLHAAKMQVDEMKNLRDNIQKHMTELAKNQGDNQTNQWIAALNANNAQLVQMLQGKLDAEEAALDRGHAYDMNQQDFYNQQTSQSMDQAHQLNMATQQMEADQRSQVQDQAHNAQMAQAEREHSANQADQDRMTQALQSSMDQDAQAKQAWEQRNHDAQQSAVQQQFTAAEADKNRTHQEKLSKQSKPKPGKK